jgi:hypothetical protein
MLIHPFVPSARATSPCDPAKSTQTVPLPNGSKLPTASISAESSEEIFLRRTGFLTKLGPQIRLSPVLIFGVNICPFNYGIKVILFRNWPQLPTSSSQICSTSILSPAIHRSLHPDPNPRSSFSQAQIFNGGSKSSCSGKFHPLKTIRHYLSSIFTSDFSLRLNRSFPLSF